LIVLLVTIFSIFSGCKFTNNESQIESIEIYNIDWYTFSGHRYDTDDILNSKNHKFNTIDSRDIISRIYNRIELLEPLPEYDGVDARMVAFLKYSNGNIDTIKIGSPRLIEYNGNVFNKDSIMVGLLERN